MLTVIRHRPWLISVIVSRNGEERDVHFGVLLRRGSHRLPIAVIERMLQPPLKNGRRVPDDLVEGAEWRLAQIELARFLNPEWSLAEEISVSSIAAGVCEPLHI